MQQTRVYNIKDGKYYKVKRKHTALNWMNLLQSLDGLVYVVFS